MVVPKNVILLWASTVASIPAGFSRVTALDGAFAKGAHDTASANITGGSDTHTHTSPAHSHNLQSHTHTSDLNSVGSDTDDCGGGTSNGIVTGSHSHPGTTMTGTSTSSSSSDAITYGATTLNSLPPYHELIFIKCGSYLLPPVGIIGLYNDIAAHLPTGWQICDGSNGTPDLRSKYVRGAQTGNDAGTEGGALTHSHVLDHSHANGAYHYHSCYSSTNGGGLDRNDGSGSDVSQGHRHYWNTDSNYANMAAYTGTTTMGETVEPAHTKLHTAYKVSGAKTPTGLIGLFLDDPTKIPPGWAVCDGTLGTPDLRDQHIKIAANDGEVGTTGGSNTHSHAAVSHSHGAGSGHTHTGTSDVHNHDRGIDGVGGDHTCRNPGQHSMINVSSETPLHDAANTTGDTANNEPSYLTAMFIQYQFDVGGAAAIAVM